ncbi:MAG TPA: methyltransferase domain-containing protein [Ilumatobacteraceae bacterium]|nr:methyltransferase domain-containing protein [Ilumatobacteraceae bacterium]
MSFRVGASSYDRFMGRYSVPLAPRFADLASVAAGQRVVDVGCGPGALTTELVVRVGAAAVAAVDPSESFVAAAQERHPTVEVHRAAAEQLPFEDDSFDAAVAQLVVHFMADPIAGLREMARVTRPDGVVAACVWDHQGGSGPLSLFWRAVHDLDASFAGEAGLAGAGDGQLVRLFREAGLRQVEQHLLWVAVEHESFEEWWEPFTLGVGPAGAYVAGLDAAGRARLREQCHRLAPAAPFVVEAAAWAARAVV